MLRDMVFRRGFRRKDEIHISNGNPAGATLSKWDVCWESCNPEKPNILENRNEKTAVKKLELKRKALDAG